jgi:hypothetical protein
MMHGQKNIKLSFKQILGAVGKKWLRFLVTELWL